MDPNGQSLYPTMNNNLNKKISCIESRLTPFLARRSLLLLPASQPGFPKEQALMHGANGVHSASPAVRLWKSFATSCWSRQRGRGLNILDPAVWKRAGTMQRHLKSRSSSDLAPSVRPAHQPSRQLVHGSQTAGQVGYFQPAASLAIGGLGFGGCLGLPGR